MGMKIKPWEELTIADDFMFCKIMSNEEVCKQMLEFMLGIKIRRLIYHEAQKSIDMAYDVKGIRMDVYVADSDRVFDVEMQTTLKSDLPKRTRYYQSLIDIDTIKKGDLYAKLKESYIIFICTEDPFNFNLPCYTFENTCREKNNLHLNDKSYKVFYNVNEYQKEANPEVKAFLELVKKNRPSSDFTEKIQLLVDEAKNRNEKWRVEYMNLEMIKTEQRTLGRQEGKLEGKLEGRLDTARNLLRLNILTNEQISKSANLTLEQVRNLSLKKES